MYDSCKMRKGTEQPVAIAVNPFDELSIRKIKYRSDGSIYSDDEEINRDVTETLNLNCEAVSLPETRKKCYRKNSVES